MYVMRLMTAKMTTTTSSMTTTKAVPYGRLARAMCTGITGCNGLIIISMPRVHRV